jgi:thioredoxin-like negative regulator of GroEL
MALSVERAAKNQALFREVNERIAELSEPTLAAEARQIPRSSTGKPILVFFYSNSSGACRRAEGFIAQVLQRRRNHDTFTLHRIDADLRPDLSERFRIDQLPTLLVVDDKRTRVRLEQPRGCAEIETTLPPWLR